MHQLQQVLACYVNFLFCLFQLLIVGSFICLVSLVPLQACHQKAEKSAAPVLWRESFMGILDYEALFISQTGLGNKRGPAGPPRTRVLMC